MRPTLLLLLLACPALAQSASQSVGQSDAMQAARSASERNRLGLLQYCHAKGAIDDEPVTLQRRVVARLSPTPDALERAGQGGHIMFDGREESFVEAAGAQGNTVKGSCEEMARRVLRQEAGR